MKNMLTIIGLVITFLGMFVGWVAMAQKDAKKRAKEREEAREQMEKVAIDAAYDRGLHDSVHKELGTQVDAAHTKLRIHEAEISELKRNDAAHAEIHKAMLDRMDQSNKAQMDQMDQIHKTIDTIHRVIMGGKGA